MRDIIRMETGRTIISCPYDTAVLFNIKTWKELKVIMERDTSIIKTLVDNKLLTLNVEKTKYISFTCYAHTQSKYD